MIRRGTHARVMAMERAIDAFLSLDALPSSSSSSSHSSSSKGEEEEDGRRRGRIRRRRQIVILGAGRDTTYLRYRFGGKKRGGDDDDVRWFEVDHPSTIEQKARVWLPRCVPDGHDYNCLATDCDDEDDDASYAIVIAPRTKEVADDDDDDDDGHTGNVAASSSYSSDYRLVGHDLRSSPDALFRKLARHGYDEKSSSSSTLFV